MNVEHGLLRPQAAVSSLDPWWQEAYSRTLLGQIDRRLLRRPAVRGLLAAVLALTLIVPAVQFVVKSGKVTETAYREGGERNRGALARWLPTTDVIESGKPYGPGHWFPLPPTVLLALKPLAAVGFVGAAIIWAGLKLAGLTASGALYLRQIGQSAMPFGVVVMAALFGLRPIVADLQHGNVNIFMFVFLAFGWGFYATRRDLLAGVMTAAAIVMKVTPGLLLVYFLYKREWRVCAAAGITLLLLVIVVPAAFIGMDATLRLHREWFDMLLRPYVVDGYVTISAMNQALYGVILRLGEWWGLLPLEHISVEDAIAAGSDVSAKPIGAAGFLKPAISIGFLASLAWLCRGRNDNRAGLRPMLEFALVLLAMLLMSERTWKHHATTLFLVYLPLWYAVACLSWTDRFRALLAGGLFVQLALMLATSEGFVGETAAEHAMFAGTFCWGLVVAYLEVGLILRRMPLSSSSGVPT